jgi:hypothetical protein
MCLEYKDDGLVNVWSDSRSSLLIFFD